MKYTIFFLQIFTGIIFLFSGVIKLIDPLGFSYKLEEYFSPSVFSIKILQDYSLFLSVLFSFYEALLGLLLILGIFKKIVLSKLFILILFFNFLTFYLAYFNKVKDCGCFGEAIAMSPWMSFGKNLFLFFFILILFFGRKYVYPIFSTDTNLLFIILGISLFIWIPFYGLNHLPLIDFTPYKQGKSIVEQMKSAKELGLEPPKYQLFYVLKNVITKEKKTFSDQDYLEKEIWKDPKWEIQENETFEKKIKDGYTPPISDFRIEKEGIDITSEVLNSEMILLIITYDITKANPKATRKLQAWARRHNFLKLPFLAISAVKPKQDYNFANWALADATMLKTILRSNPGFVLLKKGVIIKKWHWRDKPTLREFKKLIYK